MADLTERQTQSLPRKGASFARKKIKRAIAAETCSFDAVFKAGYLTPVRGAIAKIVSKIAAIAVGDRSQNPVAVFAGLQLNLGNAREISANFQFIFRNRRSEVMKPNLLVKIRRPARVARLGGDNRV